MNIRLFLAASLMMLMLGANCFAQEQNPPSMEEMAANEADRLATLLDLEDWQVFYVDSTLQHDYVAMKEEIDALQASKVSNSSLYTAVQDKWVDKIESVFQKIFTPEQWNAYLKSGAGRARKLRDKRRAQANK